ncbi:putative uncharacterized protein DDB_G0289263 [Hyalella azteca]|uniref:Uncharacterized protein n=1 Tax=Hyalella azteca TaxID=294128 RepID=A0A8B7NXV2_HYAAZ|nr:putative uncharacterized protein DDB_G0289263 [Hyalella azteca]
MPPGSREDCHLCHIHDHNHPSTLLRTSTLRDPSPPPRPRRHSRSGSMDRDYHHHDRHHHHHHHHDRERRHSRSGRVPSALARLSEHNSHSLPASRSNTLNLYPEQVSVLPDGGHRFIGGDRVSVRSLELTSPRHAPDNRSHLSLQQGATLQKTLPDNMGTMGSAYLPLRSHGGSHLSLQQGTVIPTVQDRAQDYYLQVNRLPFKEDSRKHRFNLQTVLLIGCYTLLFVMAIIIGLVLCHQNGWLGFGSPDASIAEVVEVSGDARNAAGSSIRRPNLDNGRLTNLNPEQEPSNKLQHLTEISGKPVPVHNVVKVRKPESNDAISSPGGRPRSISGASNNQNENRSVQPIPGNRPIQRAPENNKNTGDTITAGRNLQPILGDQSHVTGKMSDQIIAENRPSSQFSNDRQNPVIVQPSHKMKPNLMNNEPSQIVPQLGNNAPVDVSQNLQTGNGPPFNANNIPTNIQHAISSDMQNFPVNSHGGATFNNFNSNSQASVGQNGNNFHSNSQTTGVIGSNIPVHPQTSISSNGNTIVADFSGGQNDFPPPIPAGHVIVSNTPVQILPPTANNFQQNTQTPNVPSSGKTFVNEQIQTQAVDSPSKKQPLRIILNAGHVGFQNGAGSFANTNQQNGFAGFTNPNGDQALQNSNSQSNDASLNFQLAAAVINGHQQGISGHPQLSPNTFQGTDSSISNAHHTVNQFNPGFTTSENNQDSRFLQNVPPQTQPSQFNTFVTAPKISTPTISTAPQPASANSQHPIHNQPNFVHIVAPSGNSGAPSSTNDPRVLPHGVPLKLQPVSTTMLHAPHSPTIHSQLSTVPLSVHSGSLNVVTPVQSTHMASGNLGIQSVPQSGILGQQSREHTQGPLVLHTGNPDDRFNNAKKTPDTGIEFNDIHMEKMKILKEILDAEGSGKLLQDLITLKNNQNSLNELSEQLSETTANRRPSPSSTEPKQNLGKTVLPVALHSGSSQDISGRIPQSATSQEPINQASPRRPQRPRQPQPTTPRIPANLTPNESQEKKRNNIQVVRELLASLISSPEVQEILSTRNRQGKQAGLKQDEGETEVGKNSVNGEAMRNLLIQALAKEIPLRQRKADPKPPSSSNVPKVGTKKEKDDKSPMRADKDDQPTRTITRAQQLAHFSTGSPGRVLNKRVGRTDSVQSSREHQSVRPPRSQSSRGRPMQISGSRSTQVDQTLKTNREKAKSISKTAGTAAETTSDGVVRHWRTMDQHGTMSQGTVRSDGSFAFTNCRPADMCRKK